MRRSYLTSAVKTRSQLIKYPGSFMAPFLDGRGLLVGHALGGQIQQLARRRLPNRLCLIQTRNSFRGLLSAPGEQSSPKLPTEAPTAWRISGTNVSDVASRRAL